MSLIVLDIELTEKNVIRELGLFIDGSVQGFSFFFRQRLLHLLNRHNGTQIINMELRGVVESWNMRSCLLSLTP